VDGEPGEALGNEFGDAGLAANGINDHYGEAIAFDFGIGNLFKDRGNAARKWLGIGETSVEVAPCNFELKVVERVWNEPNECIVFENFS
jgi:hypothetical protein